MHARKSGLALLLVSSLSLTSCGARIVAPNSALDGNWYLAGEDSLPSSLQQQPFLAMAAGVSGNTIYATVETAVTCSQGSSGIGGATSATGTISADGTFLVSNAASPIDSIQFRIQGKVPSAGESTWEGTYTVFNSSSSSCIFNQTGSFIAAAYPPFHGIYSGSITGSNWTSSLPVSLKVSQGTPQVSPVGPAQLPHFYIPLTGTIAITGSSCFASGTDTGGLQSSIGGDLFQMWFSMNDGSTLMVTGRYADPTEKTLAATFLVNGGQCAGMSGSATLTLQPGHS